MQVVKQALWTHREDLLRKQNVVGCGLALKRTGGKCTNTPCVAVLVECKVPAHHLDPTDLVPLLLDNIPTDVVEVGTLRVLSLRTGRVRPAYPGVSIGHYRISAGTFGAVVYDAQTREPLILSNNHVLANETTGKDQRAAIGDPVYQPGPYDGGTVQDQIATLARFVPLRIPPPRINLVDAAIARPLQPELVCPSIYGLGLVSGVTSVQVGQHVRKSGRSTGVTHGEVLALESTVTVLLSNGREGRFDHQIICSRMGETGDSGSLGVTENNQAFGLLFAGSTTITVFNRVDHVLEALGVTLSPTGDF